MDLSFKELSSKCKERKGVAHRMGNAANREISFWFISVITIILLCLNVV